MEVQMRHGLTGALTAVDHQSVAILDAELRDQLDRDQMKVSDQLLILWLQIIVRRNDFPWHNEHVNRRLRIDVLERNAMLVLMDDGGGDFLVDDLEEDVVAEHFHPLAV